MGADGQERTISLDELWQHNTEKSCWVCIRGKVLKKKFT